MAKKGLSQQAYEPIPEGGAYEPYVPASETYFEFTVKAAVPGILFGILFGAANAYLGLQAGLTISTSIPVAVMTVAAFRALRRVGLRGTLLEANISQTVGSASSSVASGIIFTLPALFMWGMPPSLVQMTLLALCGGLLGVLFMIPLRRFLIEREHGHLPYPEGTACAEVLVASEVGGSHAKNVFLGLGVGALFKFVFTWMKVLPDKLTVGVPGLLKAELASKMSSALFGVGYILGPRIASIMVGGGLLSSLVIIPAIAYWGADRAAPFYPETETIISGMSAHDIWNRYVRYIGAGAVAVAGIITLITSIPTMIESFRIGTRQIRDRIFENAGPRAGLEHGSGSPEGELRTSRDLPLRVVGIGALVVAGVLACVPQAFGIDSFATRAVASVCVVVFAFFFVTVASRIVGLVGVTSNPTSGMTIAALLGTSGIFLLMGWTDDSGKMAALTVGCVVAIAASIAGDTSQDLKTGFLLGATPRKQQIGELIGVLTSAVFVCMTILLLSRGLGFGSEELPAPQATLMKLVIEGVLAQELPWGLVGIGAGIAIVAWLARIPPLPFAVGVYLPVSTMVPVFLGGMVRLVVGRVVRSKERKDQARESGVLFGSGLVGGEGLMGVAFCAVVFWHKYTNRTGDYPLRFGTDWTALTWLPIVLAGLVFVGMIAFFARQCLSASPTAADPPELPADIDSDGS
ncbi:MAG: oligopeptide transporter, OPT family [Planctomycetes bacterium]|nr:oligopeptide transporter, OPT family [Planctomycetota bacterium]